MPVPEENYDHDFFYDQFPPSFKWGSTSSATQIEGAWNIDGRSMSWWDSSSRKNSQSIMDQSRPDEASDSYHKFNQDVSLLQAMNATCYKFSLSWSRLLPDGTTHKINKAGVEYYDNLINSLLEHGIEPIIVLYHWDFPQELFERHPFNWMDDCVIKAFGNYAQFCFKKFGDRVKRWVPIHDPWKHSECSFGSGIHPPNVTGGKKGSPLKAFKNLLKAHTLAYKIYNKEFRTTQQGSIGISVNSSYISSPSRKYMKDEIAVPDYATCTQLRPSYNPDASGDYGSICWNDIKQTPADFVDLTCEDINSEMNLAELRNTSSSPRRSSLPSFSNTRVALNTIRTDLENPEVLLCGKGYPLIGSEITSLADLKRTQCFKTYANEILKAVVLDGCNVVGFLPGTLVDSWEWEHGFTVSYGLHQVKFEHPLKYRIQRLSAKYLTKLFKMHGFSRTWDIESVVSN